MTWPVEEGRRYRVYSTADLTSGELTLEAGPFTVGPYDPPTMQWIDEDAQDSGEKLYLIGVSFP